MKAILEERGFTSEEILSLERRDDFKSVKEQFDTIGVENVLNRLEEESTDVIEEQSNDLDFKWKSLKETISKLYSEREGIQSETEETLDDMREKFQNEAILKVENTIRNRVSWIPVFGENIANWIIQKSKEQIAGDVKNNTVSSFFSNTLFSIATSIFGLNSIFSALNSDVLENTISHIPSIGDIMPQSQRGVEALSDTLNESIDNIQGNPQEQILSEDGEELNPIGDFAIYELGVSAFLLMGENRNDNTRSIFMQAKVKEMTFGEAINNEILIDGFNDEDIILFQNLLKSQESFLDSIMNSKHENWKLLTLLEIFKEIGPYEKVFNSLHNMNFENFMRKDNSIFDLSFVSGNISGGLSSMLSDLKLNQSGLFDEVSDALLIELIRDNEKKISDENIGSVLSGREYESDSDIRFQKDFIEFGNHFISLIKSDFYLGDDENKNEFDEYITQRSLSLKEVLEFFIITGGGLDFNNYSDITKTLIYLKIWKLLGTEQWGNNVRANTYDRFIFGVTTGGLLEMKNNVPESFWNILEKLQSKSIELAKESTGLLYEAFSSLPTEVKFVVSVMSVGGVIIFFRSRVFIAKTSGLGIGVALASMLYLIAETAYGDEDFGKSHPEYSSPDDIYFGMLDELENEHNINVTPLREQHQRGDERPEFTLLSEESFDRIHQRRIEELAEDGMEISGIREYTTGNIKVEIIGESYAEKEIIFYIQGERKKIYFQGWNGEGIANDMLKTCFFVQNNLGEIFLAGWKTVGLSGGRYQYVSLQSLNNTVNTSSKVEYIILKDAWFYRDLFIEGVSE